MTTAYSGDGITFPDNTVQATAPRVGMVNRVINGGMVVDQRNAGAAQTISAGTTPYTVDRWLAYASGANATSQQVTGTSAFSNALRFTGAASNTDVLVLQRIESKNVSDFSGVTMVVQVYLWGSAAGTVSWGIDYANATDNFSAVTSVATGSISITTTPTLYTFTVATLPSNVINGMQVKFDFGALASGVTRTITGVQLEKGSTATDFEYVDYGRQLQMCQRYCFVAGAGGASYQRFGTGMNNGATFNVSSVVMPVTMRSAPTLAYSSVSHFGVWHSGVTVTQATALSVDSASLDILSIGTTVASGLAAGYVGQLLANNNTAARLTFSAEL